MDSRFLAWLSVGLWATLILLLSAGDFSLANQSGFLEPFLQRLFPNASQETLFWVHYGIRKLVHITEYAILAGLSLRAFIISGYTLPAAGGGAWILALAIALLDEGRQSFTPERTSSLKDIGFDLLGASLAILFTKNCYRNQSPDLR